MATSIDDQTRQVLENIGAILAEAGCGLEDVVECTSWIDDPRDFSRFNAVWREYFPPGPSARSTVVSKLVVDASRLTAPAPSRARPRLEVEAIACRAEG